MNPISLIEKLINEHGSSTILKERLELLRDQMSKLEKENTVLKTENATLKDKVKTVQSEINNATKEIERLNEIINSAQKNQGMKKYDEVTEKVLKIFFESGRKLSVYDCVRPLSLDVSTVQYHFDILSKDHLIAQTKIGFVSLRVREGRPTMYELTPSGRKYVVENKIP